MRAYCEVLPFARVRCAQRQTDMYARLVGPGLQWASEVRRLAFMVAGGAAELDEVIMSEEGWKHVVKAYYNYL